MRMHIRPTRISDDYDEAHMNILNEVILERMGDVPPVSKLNNFIGDQRAAQRILRFIESSRDYHWSATYFHEADDGETQITLYLWPIPDIDLEKCSSKDLDEYASRPREILASVHAATFAIAVSLAFLAADGLVALDELQAKTEEKVTGVDPVLYPRGTAKRSSNV